MALSVMTAVIPADVSKAAATTTVGCQVRIGDIPMSSETIDRGDTGNIVKTGDKAREMINLTMLLALAAAGLMFILVRTEKRRMKDNG